MALLPGTLTQPQPTHIFDDGAGNFTPQQPQVDNLGRTLVNINAGGNASVSIDGGYIDQIGNIGALDTITTVAQVTQVGVVAESNMRKGAPGGVFNQDIELLAIETTSSGGGAGFGPAQGSAYGQILAGMAGAQATGFYIHKIYFYLVGSVYHCVISFTYTS